MNYELLESLNPLAELIKSESSLVDAISNSMATDKQQELIIANAVEVSNMVAKAIKSLLE